MSNIIFRLDAGPNIGVGHIMRCITLAVEMKNIGFHVLFVMSFRVSSVDGLLLENNIDAKYLSLSSDILSEFDDASLTLKIMSDFNPDIVVVDHYRLSGIWDSMIKPATNMLVVIDDLADRTHNCNFLIDFSIGRHSSDYSGLLNDDCELLLGSSYCLLRPEFLKIRKSAIHKRSITNKVENILISFGGTDHLKLTNVILKTLIDIRFSGRISVLISNVCEWIEELKSKINAHQNVTIYIDTPDVACLMKDADLAIGALGVSSWERACVGLPCISVATAENQNRNAHFLKKSGAIILATQESLPSDVMHFLNDKHVLEIWKKLSRESVKLIDGLGVYRVVRQLIKLKINLLEFTFSDVDDLYKWQVQAGSREFSRVKSIPEYEGHVAWVIDSLSNKDRRMWVIRLADRNVGYLRLDDIGSQCEEISILISESHRGLGLASYAVNASKDKCKYKSILAYVEPENITSMNLFESCGFSKAKENNLIWTEQ